MKTVRTKILVVVLALMAGLALVLFMLSLDTYSKYKALRIGECRSIIDMSGERIDREILALQESAESLALLGRVYFETESRSGRIGGESVVSHFQSDEIAVGGGIWFEPYSISPQKLRHCYYAFHDGGSVRIEEGFEKEAYDYHKQSWYVAIKAGAKKENDTVWTPPYIDGEGTLALMTTIGAGIFNKDGKLVGMSTVDWKLDAITESISKIRPTSGSFVLFADFSNDFILSLNDKSYAENPVGKSLKTLLWFTSDGAPEKKIAYNGVEYVSFSRKLANNMIIVINVPRAELFAEVDSYFENMLIAFIGACVLISALTCIFLNRLISRPIAYLSQKASQLGAGDFDTDISLKGDDELGRLAGSFGAMAKDLKAYMENLSAVTAEKERIATELDLAREIQASILPSIFPPYPDREEFDVYGSMVPAKEVGGDFFDFFLIDENRLCVVIADVSDKGVPAALFMMISKTLIKNFAQLGLSAGEVFERANRQLCENNEVNMFVTAFMGILDIRSGEFSYVNAGHNPPFVSKNGGAFEMIDMPSGLVLGGLEDSKYEVKSAKLAKGDTLYLYTDGVTEAFNEKLELFSEERLAKCLNSNREADVRMLLSNVSKCVSAFSAGTMQNDDITMLGLHYNGSDQPAKISNN